MNKSALRLFIRNIITEAKEIKAAAKKEPKLPKSSGKFMDLKKELTALEQYRDELKIAKFAEKTARTEVEFADLSKFSKELDALKEKGIKLEQDIEAKIEDVKARMATQKDKIKEMIGLTPSKGQEKIEDIKEPEASEDEIKMDEEDTVDDSEEEKPTLEGMDEAKKKVIKKTVVVKTKAKPKPTDKAFIKADLKSKAKK